MRLTAVLLAMLVVLALGASCAPRPVTDKSPVGLTNAAPQALAARPGASPAATPSPAPSPAASATPGAGGQAPAAPDAPAPIQHSRSNPWRIPEGKLDDAKFITISAKYTVASLQLSDKERTNDELMRVVLKAILKEANVSVEEYAAYADQVAGDEARRTRVSDAILAMARQHGAANLDQEGSAQVTKMKALGKLDRQGNPVEDEPAAKAPASDSGAKAGETGKVTDW